jgi:hypothetical protein
MATDRVRPREDGTERETLEQMLDWLRVTAMSKVDGLTGEQAATAAVPPSTLTPLGVVKHLAGTERFWFSIDFAGLDLPHPWPEDDRHGAFGLEPGDTVAGVLAGYRAECQRSRDAVAAAGLDDRARAEGMHFTLRYAYAHMIEETARHCGHLDLLRERLDGSTGQ